MTRSLRSQRAVLVACLTVGLGATGCSVIGGDDWVPLDDALATRQDVRDLTQELAGIIADEGLEPYGAYGRWATCSDDAHAWEYVGAARLDGTGPAIDTLDRVLDQLVSEAGLVTQGPAADNDPEVARGTIGGLDIRVRGNADDPALLLDVYGPCMPIAPDDRDDLDQGDIGGQELDIGGWHHIGPDSDGR